MAVTLTATDLYEDISKDEADYWATRFLAVGQTDPVTSGISDARDEISLYANPYTIRDGALRKIWKTLAICSLFDRLGAIPPKWQKKYDRIIGVLEGIRDKKFPDLVIDTTVAEAVVLEGIADGGTIRGIGVALPTSTSDQADDVFGSFLIG